LYYATRDQLSVLKLDRPKRLKEVLREDSKPSAFEFLNKEEKQ